MHGLDKVFTTGESQYVEEFKVLRGREVWLGTWLLPVRDGAGEVNAVVGLSRDVSQRMRVEAALRASEAKFRGLFENVLEGVYQTTADGRILTANPALIRMLGYSSEEEFMRLDAHNLYLTPDARQVFVRILQTEGEVRRHEAVLKRIDGRPVIVLESARAVRDERGDVLYFEGIVTDITERKQLEEQFRQAQKMEAIGRLASGIAHDFNNLLTTILGYCELVLSPTDDNPHTADVEMIKQAAQSAAGLTRQLLVFSRKQVLQPTVLDLNAVVTNVHQMLRRVLGEDIVLRTSLDPNLAAIKADAGQIEQVLMNLAVNARDAMHAGGELLIETANVMLDETDVRKHAEVAAGPYVLLAVGDTGSGMTPHTLSHLFEPFFTTKEPGKGTGLGLATVYGIVKQSGGYIRVHSELGRGTTFKIYLPQTGESVSKVETDSRSATPLRGSETVLIVEDDEAVRELVRLVLEGHGYRVFDARRPSEAVAFVQQHEGIIHLLVTDVVMPDMNGQALADLVLRMRPKMKVLYTSGYSHIDNVPGGALEGCAAFLPKPFAPAILARKVRDLLDAQG